MVFSEFPLFKTMLPWQRPSAHTHHLQNCKQPDSESLGSLLTKKHYEQLCLRGGFGYWPMDYLYKMYINQSFVKLKGEIITQCALVLLI